MQKFHSADYISAHGIISDQVDARELGVILDECVTSFSVDGAIVEFGCYIGTTSLYIRRLLHKYNDAREYHVYDSFEGLPEKRAEDRSPLGEQFQAGALSVSKKQFVHEFKKAGLRTPRIHKAWFRDLLPSDIPDSVSFAFLDGDYYESIMTPLRLLTPKLVKGATIIVDDYANQALPGAAKAVDEWCAQHQKTLTVVHSLAVIRV